MMHKLLILLSFISPLAYGNVSPYQAIFVHLLNVSHIHDVEPSVNIHIVKDGTTAAWSNLQITVALDDIITLCRYDKDCVAFLAAHEIGHQVIGHVRGNTYYAKQQEHDADIYAVELLNKAGLDPCGGLKFFGQLMLVADGFPDPEHPKLHNRYIYINKYCHSKHIQKPQEPWRYIDGYR